MSNQGEAQRFEWERVGRVIARNVPGRARYPSVVRADDGSVLVLFSQQTPEQEGVSGAAAGAGDLVLLRSGNDGQTWSRFTQRLEEYKNSPAITRRRLWLDFAKEVLAKIQRKYVVETDETGPAAHTRIVTP